MIKFAVFMFEPMVFKLESSVELRQQNWRQMKKKKTNNQIEKLCDDEYNYNGLTNWKIWFEHIGWVEERAA